MQATCLEVVPDETRPWNPEMAPHAIVMNRKGIMGGAPSGEGSITGATIVGCSTRRPPESRNSPVRSWCEVR